MNYYQRTSPITFENVFIFSVNEISFSLTKVKYCHLKDIRKNMTKYK